MLKANSVTSDPIISDLSSDECLGAASASGKLAFLAKPESIPDADSVLSEFNRLSESFVHSYQNLESQVEKLSGKLQDETREKQSMQQEKQQLLVEKAALSDRLQSLLAVMPAGVVVIDGKGQVKDCNAVAIDILGRPLLGQLWVTVIERAFNPQADDGHQVSLKDGRKIHIETRALDSEPGQLVVLTDLTKTRQLQAELSQQQKLSSMGKMIASLAHQIRTPLSAAILYGSHLNDQNIMGSVRRQFSNNLMERLHCMERQINDMLNFMKGERKQKNPVSVKQLFKKLNLYADSLPQNIQFTLEGETQDTALVVADEDALIAALTNLLENACDACSDTAKPQINMTFKVNGGLQVVTQDNGIGISENEQKKLFEPFYSNKKNGNGLGLAILHGVVIDHQGSVRVKSKLGVGSRFEITLPLQAAAKPNQSPHQDLPQEQAYEF